MPRPIPQTPSRPPPTTRSSSAPASPAAPPRSSSAAPATASRWSRSSPTRRPTSASARTSSRPRACRRSNGWGCSSRSKRPAAERPRVRMPGPSGAGSRRRRSGPARGRQPAPRGARPDGPLDRRRDARRRADARLDAPSGCCSDGETVAGVAVRNPDGEERELRARLTVGADGRDSRIAELSEVPVKTYPHDRFAYGAYFEGGGPGPRARRDRPGSSTRNGRPPSPPTTASPSTRRCRPRIGCREFKRDPEGALVNFLADVPEAPPIREGRLVDAVMGKVDMTNRMRRPVAPGLALVGDAALATDPLFGVGCGWAFQSAEWLSDSVRPRSQGDEPLDKGLARYRRRPREGAARARLLHPRLLDGPPLQPGRADDLRPPPPATPEAATLLDAAARGRSGRRR